MADKKPMPPGLKDKMDKGGKPPAKGEKPMDKAGKPPMKGDKPPVKKAGKYC